MSRRSSFELHKEQKQNVLQLHDDFSEIENLVEQYENMLYNLCYRLTQNMHDAQDLYQQTWLKAISRINLYANKSMKNWLYTICLNLYRDNYRKSKRKEQTISSKFSSEAQEKKRWKTQRIMRTAESVAINNINNELLLEKIDQLSDKLRVPIILFYFDGFDYKAIAGILRVPIGTVKSRLNLAKEKLRKEMEKEYHV